MTPLTADLIQEMPEVGETNVGEINVGALNGSTEDPSMSPPTARATSEVQGILESLLFVSSEPISVTRAVAVLEGVTKAEVEEGLHHLGQALEQDGRGIRLAKVAGGYRLVTKQEYASWVRRLDKTKNPAKLSQSALESLAIIAYKQPLVRAEIEEIRGVETSGVLRTLLERKLVRIVGRKEVPGRPIMYGTTKFFLEHFGLNDLSQLPPLREFKELGEAEQAMLPMGAIEVPQPETSVTPIDGSSEHDDNGEHTHAGEVDISIQPDEAFDSLHSVGAQGIEAGNSEQA